MHERARLGRTPSAIGFRNSGKSGNTLLGGLHDDCIAEVREPFYFRFIPSPELTQKEHDAP